MLLLSWIYTSAYVVPVPPQKCETDRSAHAACVFSYGNIKEVKERLIATDYLSLK